MAAYKEIMLRFIDQMEELALKNFKLRMLVRSLIPPDQEQDFSIDSLLAETSLEPDIEKAIRKLYDDFRKEIREGDDPEVEFRRLLIDLPIPPKLN